ncbi:hypothetical protein HYW20_03710 [Candidatus Woesearchaeota archaeon]|nr:hypothetical protein [Candidatus Woesearchaeota archaeon]
MMKERTEYPKQTYNILLQEYMYTCGNQGRKLFEEKVLPNAFEYFNGDYRLLVKEIRKIIENAGECKSSEIGRYLSSITFQKETPKKKNSGKRPANTQDSLEKLVRKLEGWLIIYNEGK